MTNPTDTRLPDRWADRDFPLLLAIARKLDQGETSVDVSATAHEIGLGETEALRSARDLFDIYVKGQTFDSVAGAMGAVAVDLTERGRRATGLWPSGEGSEALVEALRQAEDATEDLEEKGDLRRAASAIMGVGREVMTDVMAAVVVKQVGG